MSPNYTQVPLKDLTVVKVNIPVSDANISPIVVFASKENLQNTLSINWTVYLSGETSGLKSGTFYSATVDGQFNAIIGTEGGDSGGPVTATIDDINYITGVLSASRGDIDVVSYMNLVEYYNVMSQPIFGPTNSFQDVKPDLIISATGASNNFYRGTKKKASFILDETYSSLVTGSGGDTVNTGSGTDNVIFTQDIVGETDTGTTFVVSPGYDYIVGASANDRLVILKDRLFKYQGSSSSTSDVIKLKGSVTSSTGDGFVCSFAPSYADETLKGDFYVTYHKINNEGRTDLIIHVEAPDESSDRKYRGSLFKESIWTGTIHVIDYKEGDLGLRFVDDKSQEVKDSPDDIWEAFLSNPESGVNVNDYKNDVWNGVKSWYNFGNQINGPSYGDINWSLTNIVSTYVDNPELSINQPANAIEGDGHLSGTTGNDGMRGGFGDDVLDGDDGNDLLFGNLGDDVMIGVPETILSLSIPLATLSSNLPGMVSIRLIPVLTIRLALAWRSRLCVSVQ